MSDTPARDYDASGEAKRLLRTVRAGTLATITDDGHPHASLVAVATLPDGSPILLLSQLAAHTRHVQRDGRASLLLAQAGRGDPLAHPRLTLLGQALVIEGDERPEARRRFLARNPKSELYADFPDFSFWRVVVETGHLNGGFGKAASLEASALLTPIDGSDALIAGEEGAVAHMNADHKDAIQLYATRLARLPEGDWRISGLDPEGLDLVAGDRTGRLVFPAPVRSGAELRKTLVELAAQARSA